MGTPHLERHIFVCTNRRDAENPKGCCASKGAEKVREAFKKAVFEEDLRATMRANAAGCLDQCDHGVTVVVYPEQVWYGKVTPEDVAEIVSSHLKGGVPVERLRIRQK